MQTITMEQFQEAYQAQSPCRELITFKCPRCGCLQNAMDLMIAGAGKSFDEVEKYLGFSCRGRWTDAKPPRQNHDGAPCNWTLGGLFKAHTVELVDQDGRHHPIFELASLHEAEEHRRKQAAILMEGLVGMYRAIPQPEKPLFIPLAGQYYDQFEDGSKAHEYRMYGPRWNEDTCRIGRAVTLSRGYGKQRRLQGTVTSFQRIPFHAAPDDAREIFAGLADEIAAIGIEVNRG